MFVLEDLKNNKKDVMEKILLESGRGEVISFCSEVLDKRAYFTVDVNGKIKRKKLNYIIPAAVFMESDADFINYTAENLDFAEKIKIEKIQRMTNAETSYLKKNIFKLLAKGEYNFALSYCKELYMRDKDDFFKMVSQFAMMDNISFEKPLVVYSLKKYFEKFGYSDEVLYLAVSYLGKMRADFHDYEAETTEESNSSFSKENLKEILKKDINRYKTRVGFGILAYSAVLLSNDYENEKIFLSLIEKKIKLFENGLQKDETLTKTAAEIFDCLSKEV